jgi:hypothetical protein
MGNLKAAEITNIFTHREVAIDKVAFDWFVAAELLP